MCVFDRGKHSRGLRKRGNAEFQRFLGLCKRAGVSLLLAYDLRLLNEPSYEKLNAGIVEIKRMLASLVRKIEQERLAS